MEQENNNILNLFNNISKILTKPKESPPTQNPLKPIKSSNSKCTVDFIRAHEMRKNSIINKNKSK